MPFPSFHRIGALQQKEKHKRTECEQTAHIPPVKYTHKSGFELSKAMSTLANPTGSEVIIAHVAFAVCGHTPGLLEHAPPALPHVDVQADWSAGPIVHVTTSVPAGVADGKGELAVIVALADEELDALAEFDCKCDGNADGNGVGGAELDPPGGGEFDPPGGGEFDPPGGGAFDPPGGGELVPPGGGEFDPGGGPGRRLPCKINK